MEWVLKPMKLDILLLQRNLINFTEGVIRLRSCRGAMCAFTLGCDIWLSGVDGATVTTPGYGSAGTIDSRITLARNL